MKELSKQAEGLPRTISMNGILKVLQRLPGSKFILEQVGDEYVCLTITHGRYQEETTLTRHEHIETNADLLIDRIVEREATKLTEDLSQDKAGYAGLPNGYSVGTHYENDRIGIKLYNGSQIVWFGEIPVKIKTPSPPPPETYEPGDCFQDKNGDIYQIINIEFGKCQLIDVDEGSPIGNVIDIHDLNKITMDEVDRMYFENTDCLVPVEITHHIVGEE